ncbi:MAG: hypothetical protein ABIJ34_00585 [archaeon]
MIHGRKGSIFVLMLTILFIFAVLPMLYFAVHTKSAKFEKSIGEKQAVLMETYEHGEVPLYYIDKSADKAYQESIDEIAISTGCGEFEGYPLLNTESKNCIPDLKAQIKSGFEERFISYLDNFPEKIPEIGYDYYIINESEETVFIGKAKKSLRMDIGGKDYNFAAEEVKFVEPPPIVEEPQEPIPQEPSAQEPSTSEPSSEEPIPPDVTTESPTLEGKCAYLIEYADKFVGCPYLLNCGYANYIACQYFPPNDCRIGLTCATFVGSVITQQLGFSSFSGHGATKCSSNSDKVIMLGSNVNTLKPGDVFQAGNNIGHTGMYAGTGTLSGEISYFGIRTCYEHFSPSPSGRNVFIHSIGNSDGGPPGVCYEYYEDLFAEGRNQVTQFCRLKACE